MREDTAQHVLSMMAMCGMYDAAGEWMLRVGLPAKSGVSGGAARRQPGSVRDRRCSARRWTRAATASRGVLACERLAERFGLHLLHDATSGARAAKVLEQDGDVSELRGDIDFAAAELVLRKSRRTRAVRRSRSTCTASPACTRSPSACSRRSRRSRERGRHRR